jgi:murein L,D-transpeptidase YcbB/YkuD
MDDDGKLGRTFWRSLNVSAKERAEQIMLNMKRWRLSDVQHHDHPLYVLVNIPDFTVEIWKQQQQEMRSSHRPSLPHFLQRRDFQNKTSKCSFPHQPIPAS